MAKKKTRIKIIKNSIFILLLLSLSGCAARKEISGELPEITAEELIDSLVAQDTLAKTFHIRGKGTFSAGGKDEKFAMSMLIRRPDKMHVRIAGPLGVSIAVLWLCGNDSMCIYIPSKATVLVEPLGADIPDVILPPSAPVMLDMFCGMAPIYRFSDSLQNFEKSSDGYYLTFRRGDEVFVALAKPDPWHIAEFQWAKISNTGEQVDVKFEDGELRNGVWRPKKIEITAPALKQKISAKIIKDRMNIEIPDSMFAPKIPLKTRWQSAF